jgi:alpha-ribazole phosphatase
VRDIYLIRHGETFGNEEKRYVGSTDEPLSETGIRKLEQRKETWQNLITPKTVYTSPMLRCRQTAELLFPQAELIAERDFREKDFGEFEYKNYKDLAGNSHYQKFIDSGGKADFPDAEPQAVFLLRTARAFAQCIHAENSRQESSLTGDAMVFVLHGGTIMSILHQYAFPHRDFFNWQIAPMEGYTGKIRQEQEELQIINIRKM